MIQRDSNIIVVSRIQLLVNKNFFHLLFFDLIVKTSQNLMHSILVWNVPNCVGFWGGAQDPLGSLRRSPRPPSQHGLLAFGNRSCLQFPKFTCLGLYMRKTQISPCPESTPLAPIAPRYFNLKFVPLLEIP